MAPEETPTYGVLQKRNVQDELDLHIEELEYLGYTAVKSGLTAAEIGALRKSIDLNYKKQLAETAEAAMTADTDILRCPLIYDDIFIKVATTEPLLEICKRLLGMNFVLLQQNAIINRPTTKEYQSRWHRDLPYQHFVTSKKLALNALLCVDEFTPATGGTVVLPGTHQFESFPSPKFVCKHELTMSGLPGSLLVLDAMLFHRSGYNVSAKIRRGVNHLIGRPLLVQQMDLPRLLGDRYSNDPFLRGYLGYQWNPASSVTAWRKQRA
jgi:hypothetical protein